MEVVMGIHGMGSIIVTVLLPPMNVLIGIVTKNSISRLIINTVRCRE